MLDTWLHGRSFPEARRVPQVRAHAVVVLARADDEELCQYLLQLVQARVPGVPPLVLSMQSEAPQAARLVACGPCDKRISRLCTTGRPGIPALEVLERFGRRSLCYIGPAVRGG